MPDFDDLNVAYEADEVDEGPPAAAVAPSAEQKVQDALERLALLKHQHELGAGILNAVDDLEAILDA